MMEEENRRAAILAAADAVRFADRQGGDVWLAAAQLDSALLELRSALRRRQRFESRFELPPEIHSVALAATQGLPYYWLRETYALSTTDPVAQARGAVEQLTRRGVVVVVVNDREQRISIDRERRIPERERDVEILEMEMERITAFSVAAAAC